MSVTRVLRGEELGERSIKAAAGIVASLEGTGSRGDASAVLTVDTIGARARIGAFARRTGICAGRTDAPLGRTDGAAERIADLADVIVPSTTRTNRVPA